MNLAEMAGAFLKHWWSAKKYDRFHSPYLFRLFTFCCSPAGSCTLMEVIENQRKQWRLDLTPIERTDHGAGSYSGNTSTAIANLAKTSLSFPYQCRFLHQLVQFHQPADVLELGTSLGISTAYMAIAAPHSKIHSVEGDPRVASIAQQFFQKNNFINISLYTNTFENFLANHDPSVRYDLVFIDGHHTGAAVNRYYQFISQLLNDTSIIVVDDIHWSHDMYNGWLELIARPEITQSVDCFHFGLVFFRKDFMNKEHHKINLPWKAFQKA